MSQYVPVSKKQLYCSLSLKSLSITILSIKFPGKWQAVLALERSFITITSPEGAAGCCYGAWSWEMQRASGICVERGKEPVGGGAPVILDIAAIKSQNIQNEPHLFVMIKFT
jgi:hypothetical protein